MQGIAPTIVKAVVSTAVTFAGYEVGLNCLRRFVLCVYSNFMFALISFFISNSLCFASLRPLRFF